jgi:sarcosine oxidase
VASFEVIVVGGGVMGCAAAYHLAKEGHRVLLLERFTIGNQNGSSHGVSRLFRLIHARADYVTLARTALAAWRDLEAETEESLLTSVHGLDLGPRDALAGFRKTMEATGVWFEPLERDEIVRRFPQFALPDDVVGLFQHDYGLFAADRCVTLLAERARFWGTEVAEHHTVRSIQPIGREVTVVTDRGTFTGERLVLAAGSWIGPLTRQLGLELPLTVTKEIHTYFRPSDPRAFLPDRFPLFRQHLTGMEARWGVGYPIFRHRGAKMVVDCTGRVVDDPEDPDRSVDESRLAIVRRYVASILPTLGNDMIAAESCRYTMTPDQDFILDRHPGYPQIVLGSPCSGHGFKFAILIGRILADLAIRGTTDHEISRFRLRQVSPQ